MEALTTPVATKRGLRGGKGTPLSAAKRTPLSTPRVRSAAAPHRMTGSGRGERQGRERRASDEPGERRLARLRELGQHGAARSSSSGNMMSPPRTAGQLAPTAHPRICCSSPPVWPHTQ